MCSLYGPCSSVTARASSCTAASGFSWERKTLSFGGDVRVKHHLLSQASWHAYKQEGRFCFSCVWAFCFSWGGEGALAFSDCSRKAESAYTLCPHGLSFHSAPFLTQRSSSFNSLFASPAVLRWALPCSHSPQLLQSSGAWDCFLLFFFFLRKYISRLLPCREQIEKLSWVWLIGIETRKTIK